MTHFQKTRGGFTLIELLVVIAIISILASILFPAFASAKIAAKRIVSVSNVKQLAIATMMYVEDNGGYPLAASPTAAVPQTTWVDHIYPYVKSTEIYTSPLTPDEMKTREFAFETDRKYGGYGYNYQYLGNSYLPQPFGASSHVVSEPSDTILFSDTQGVRNDAGAVTAGVHVIDPPLPSLKGSGKPSGFFGDGAECGSGTGDGWGQFGCRAAPAEWAQKRVTVAWVDGHANNGARSRMDDKNKDGAPDNGYWNGDGDSTKQ